jgi:Protein of unknown function (DUF3592)
MRRYSMPNSEAWARIRPSGKRDRHQLWVLSGYLALLLLFVALIFYLKHRHREDLEQNWVSATAVILDVRPEQIGVINTTVQDGILYRVSILVKYRFSGKDEERWIIVDQRPTSLVGAKLQAFRWKGHQCIVRWKPSDPDKVIAEVS